MSVSIDHLQGEILKSTANFANLCNPYLCSAYGWSHACPLRSPNSRDDCLWRAWINQFSDMWQQPGNFFCFYICSPQFRHPSLSICSIASIKEDTMTKDNLRKRESFGLMISERKSIMIGGCLASCSCSRNLGRSHFNQTKETEQTIYAESVLWQDSPS